MYVVLYNTIKWSYQPKHSPSALSKLADDTSIRWGNWKRSLRTNGQCCHSVSMWSHPALIKLIHVQYLTVITE